MPLVCRVEWAEPGNRINAFEFFSSLCIAKLISPPVDFMCSVSISFSYSAHMAKGPSHMGTHTRLYGHRGSFVWMWTMQVDLGISSEELPSCHPQEHGAMNKLLNKLIVHVPGACVVQ